MLTKPSRGQNSHNGIDRGAVRRVLRVACWNALLLIAVLALIGLAGEVWLRSKGPFMAVHHQDVFVADMGPLLRPRTEVRWTNRVDFWTVSRANSLGFLDREPPSPARAAESCHIAVIGDSFVAAKEVQISEKFHVRLEEMAARELPALDVTTSAFGKGGTGQIDQLAWYDEYARHLRPRLVVLVFVPNDFVDNFPFWRGVNSGLDPDHSPYVSAERAADGGFRLRPPDPDYRRFRLPRVTPPVPRQWAQPTWATPPSLFWSWLNTRIASRTSARDNHRYAQRTAWLELLSQRPTRAPLFDERQSASKTLRRILVLMSPIRQVSLLFADENDGPLYTETLAFTAFALDEFKKRAERDGAALAILAQHDARRHGGGVLARLNELAAERRIPVVDHGDFINRQGAELYDAEWAHDGHWNLAGHRWAAEALLEYLKQNQELCE